MARILISKSRPLRWAVVLWLIAEVVAYAVVIERLGVGVALLIGIGSTCIGFAMLRRVGMAAVGGLRRGLGAGATSQAMMVDGSLSALGAVLLILPGFLSDLVGLALAAPSVRQWFARRGAGVARPGRQATATIDLGPADWHPVEHAPSDAGPRVTRGMS